MLARVSMPLIHTFIENIIGEIIMLLSNSFYSIFEFPIAVTLSRSLR